MLRLDAQDDILELCQSVQMDPSAYQRFQIPIAAPPTPPSGDHRIVGPEAKLQPLAEPKRLTASTEIAPPRNTEQQNLSESHRLSLAAPDASSFSDRRD